MLSKKVMRRYDVVNTAAKTPKRGEIVTKDGMMAADTTDGADVQQLSKIVARQNAQLKALNEANLLLSEERLVSAVLQRVVDISRELSGARYAALGVLDESGHLKAFITSGIDERARASIGKLPSGKGLLGAMLERTEPLRVDNMSDHPSSVGFPSGHPDMTSFLGVPIRRKGRAVGSLYLADKDGGAPFDQADEEIVRLFSNQAAVAIENAQLNEQIQALAVETERTRISREMHDGLAQVLGYINTKAQAVEELIANKDFEAAEEHLKEMSKTARQAYREVREGILALRTQVGAERSLADALNEYITEFQVRLGRNTEVKLTIPDAINLEPLQEVQILRIVQEALTNVRKHADAKTVWVSICQLNAELQIEVRDDGQGFNPLAVKRQEWPHLGLQTMQERAEAIGGTFLVESTPGKGTKLTVSIPNTPSIGSGQDET